MEGLARVLSDSGPYSMVVVPLTDPAAGPQGKATFLARVHEASPLYPCEGDAHAAADGSGGLLPQKGSVALVVAFDRDAGVVAPGRPLIVAGRFSLAPQALNPGDFDERRYLESDRVFVQFECVRVQPCPAQEVPWASRAIPFVLGAARRWVGSSIDSSLPEGEGAVLKALFLGERGSIPDDMSVDFRRSGFYRFASVAGFHVDLAFLAVEGLMRKVSKRPSASRFVAAMTVFLYGSISGWSPGAVRAFFCAAMRSFAPALRKRYDGLAGVSAAALVLAFAMPFPLRDVGFQMSFAGALGGLIASRFLRRARAGAGSLRADGWPGVLGRAAEICFRVVMSFAFLLPVASSGLPEISIAGFALGGIWAAAAAALLPASLPLFLAPAAGRLAGWIPYLFVLGIARLSSWVSSLGWASVTVPAFGALEVVAYYAILGLAVDSGMRRLQDGAAGFRGWESQASRPRHGTIRHAAFAVSCATLFLSAVFRVYLPWPRVVFFAVGQGDCALVRYRGTIVLVDVGTSSACENTVLRQLRRLGIFRLDACVISHLHEDHVGGLPALCREVQVEAAMTARGTAERLGDLLRTPGIPDVPQIVEVPSGSQVRIGDLTALAFCQEGPAEGADAGNSETLVLVITPGRSGFSIEFWGDAPAKAIEEAMRGRDPLFAGPSVARVVKVPHHGSRDSLIEGFYDRLGIAAAVISVGPNFYGHPSKEVLESAGAAGVRLLRTDTHGAVTVDFLLGRPLARSFK